MADWTNQDILESLGLPFTGEGCEAKYSPPEDPEICKLSEGLTANADAAPEAAQIWYTNGGKCFKGPIKHPDNPQAATVIPIADNELDTAIRAGAVGVSLLYARQDHNHPIKRQAMPADPVLTFAGAAGSSMSQSIVLDRWSDEESVTFATRSLVLSAGGVTGWDYISIPNIAGFQRPQITIEGTYRYSGTPSDQFPRAQYMGNEANHWSSTQRVYIGSYPAASKPVAARRYIAITIKYTRT